MLIATRQFEDLECGRRGGLQLLPGSWAKVLDGVRE
jgi:hypothetical protein